MLSHLLLPKYPPFSILPERSLLRAIVLRIKGRPYTQLKSRNTFLSSQFPNVWHWCSIVWLLPKMCLMISVSQGHSRDRSASRSAGPPDQRKLSIVSSFWGQEFSDNCICRCPWVYTKDQMHRPHSMLPLYVCIKYWCCLVS